MSRRPGATGLYPYALVSPAVLIAAVIVLLPMVYTAALSLFQYVLWKPKDVHFIWLGNYAAAIKDPVFRVSLLHTLLWIVGVIALQFLLGFCTALLLNRDFFWRGLARSLILIPWVTPSVITSLMWRWMYDGNAGVINHILKQLGLITKFVPWLAGSTTALPAVMVALMWQGFPFFAIMILAGLQSIPRDYYEAAETDGASWARRFFSVTVPLLSPVIFTTLLLRTIWVANSFDVIYIMTGGGPGYSTYTVPLYSYLTAYKTLNFGFASTLAVAMTIVVGAIVALYVVRIMRTEDTLR